MVGGLIEFAGELGFGLETAVTPDVVYFDAVLQKDASDEKAPMAACWIFFGAEKDDAEFLDASFKPGEALEEKFGFGDAVVKYVAFEVVVLGAFRATAEFATEIEILKSVFVEAVPKRLLIELRSVVGIRI